VSQDPVPTTPVERGGTVTVRVSKGPDLVAVPDLTGLTYPQAQQVLTDAGYVVNSLLGTTEGIFVSISVVAAASKKRATFPRGTGVDLIFL
jgi:serine/threonine-protein kinase